MYSIIAGMCGSVCLKTTMFNFTGLRPTRRASWIPRRTGRRSPCRISWNTFGSSESIDTFTRFRPAFRRASARPASIEPFVVIETSGMWRTVRSITSSMSSRTSGSPPVYLTDVTPNSRATRTIRSISATDISSSWGIRGARIWHNKRAPLFTWRVLRDGVCDGCALGTTGLKDFTMEGVHLCTVRLNLLPLNTMGAMDTRVLEDVAPLVGRPGRDLRHLGRLPYPMVRRRGDRGFRRVTWDEALDLVAGRLQAAPPERVAFYLTSRGITNEVYYVAGKVARFLGTNHVDNSARLCHAPSTTAMKETLGVAASTCSYSDWIGSDPVVFFGSDVPNNQPVTTKYLYYAKKHGTKVAVAKPFREPGLDRYWVPSVFDSAFFGTRLADAFFQIHTGGDVAFINGVMKHLIADGWIDDTFIAEHTTGVEALHETLDKQARDVVEKQ